MFLVLLLLLETTVYYVLIIISIIIIHLFIWIAVDFVFEGAATATRAFVGWTGLAGKHFVCFPTYKTKDNDAN